MSRKPLNEKVLLDAMGKALGKVIRDMRAETAEKREAALVPIREENARLLVRIAALEAKVEGRPSENTVIDMRRVLAGRRRAA